MNCSEFEQWTGPYLSGEVEGPLRAELADHRHGCPACARLVERCTEIDDRVRMAVLEDEVDPSAVVAGARNAIEGRSRRLRWMGIAAGLVFALGGLAFWTQSRKISDELAAAARDHRVEVVGNSPRRWREAASEVRQLLSQYNVDTAEVNTLVPAGFVLQKAKQCGIDGERALHMVFSDGTRALSVYVRSPGTQGRSGEAEVDGVAVAAFHSGKVAGIVAAPERKLCEDAVRRLSAL